MSKKSWFVIGAAVTFVTVASPAAASDAQGYRVTFVAEHGLYCVRPTATSEAERLGIPLYRTQCLTKRAWAMIGLEILRA